LPISRNSTLNSEASRQKKRAIILSFLMIMLVQTSYFTGSQYEPIQEPKEQIEAHGTGGSSQHLNETSLSVGSGHTCVFGDDTHYFGNRMKCWGTGGMGQLGIGNTQDIGDDSDEMGENLPFVDTGNGLNITKVTLGESHTCALFENGSVKCWGETTLLGIGYNDVDGFGDGYQETGEVLPYLPLPSGRTVVEIEAGHQHTCAILDNGEITCWGDNSKGQLGIGNTSFMGDSADEIGDYSPVTSITPSLASAAPVSLAMGWDHSCALFSNGEVFCWGDNSQGQLGIGSTSDIGDGPGEMGSSLAAVDFPTGRTAVEITAGDDFTCAILDNGDVACWGYNSHGQLGIGTSSNRGDTSGQMGDSTIITDINDNTVLGIDAGKNHVCALVSASRVKCWGANQAGQLGYGDTQNRGDGLNEMGANLALVNTGSQSIVDVSAGDGMTCTMNSIRAIQCWGLNVMGQLGIESTNYIGDDGNDMPPSYTEIEIFTNFKGSGCDSYIFPPFHPTFTGITVDETSNDVGNVNDMEALSNGCPAVSYADDENDDVKLAVFLNGLWTVETPITGTNSVLSTAITVDSEDRIHVIAADPSYDSTSQDVIFATKVAGRWVITQLAQSEGAETVDILSTSSGLAAIWSTGSKLTSFECSSNCHQASQWSEAFDESHSGISNLEAVHDAGSDTTHVAFVTTNANSDPVLQYLSSSGTTNPTTSVISSDTASSTTERVVSMDMDAGGNLFIAHSNSSGDVTLYTCDTSASGCGTASNWNSEDTGLTGSEIQLAVDLSMEPHVVSNDAGSIVVSSRSNGVWSTSQVFNYESDWSSILIDNYGRTWIAAHVGASDDLWVFNAWGFAGNGFELDVDGDGFTGYDELRCGTDPGDASSSPEDFDLDGTCDSLDDRVDLPAVGDSSILTMGDSFGCAVSPANDIYCWGLNDKGQLGRTTTGNNAQTAGDVTGLPSDFRPVSLDAGADHVCAVGADGSVWCWGSNAEGQLGTGSTASTGSPAPAGIPAGVRATSVSAGPEHTCATTSKGRVLCWGTGTSGQLGESSLSLPLGFSSGGEFNTVFNDYPMENFYLDSARGYVARSTNQGVHSSYSGMAIPGPISQWGGTGTHTVSFDWSVSSENCYDDANFGRLTPGNINLDINQCNLGGGWTSASYSYSPSTENIGWWYFKDGSANVGTDTMYVDDIVVTDGSGTIVYEQDFDSPSATSTRYTPDFVSVPGVIEEVSAGSRHTCALDSQSRAWCWGFNGGISEMTLGSPSMTAGNSTTPVLVDLTGGGSQIGSMPGLRSISAGQDVTCGLVDSGTETICWGEGLNEDELLGSAASSHNGTYADLGTTGDRHTGVSVGIEHACAVVESTIECWGRESSGELGDAGAKSSNPTSPVTAVIGYGTPVEVSVGYDATCAVLRISASDSFNRIGCWGESGSGQMGSGSMPDQTSGPSSEGRLVEYTSTSPVQSHLSSSAIEKSPSSIDQLELGYDYTCTVSVYGLVKCRGHNNYGQLGVGSTTGTVNSGTMPWTDLGSNRTVSQLSAGYNFNCAILDGGDVKCWGYNGYGQLGYGDTQTRGDSPSEMGDNLPTLALGQPAVDVSAGYNHACAVLLDGTLKCWGHNGFGELGIGDQSTRSIPVTVDLGTGMVARDVEAGIEETCVIMVSGQVKCWGRDYAGVLGNPGSGSVSDYFGNNNDEIADALPFIDFGPSRTAVSLSLKSYTACAILTDATTVCWGEGTVGQLGTGTTEPGKGDAPDLDGDGFADDMGEQLVDVQLWNGSIYQPSYEVDPLAQVSVGSGYNFACAVGISGNVWCWGDDSNQVQGNGPSLGTQYAGRTVEMSPHSAEVVEAGGQSACMLTVSSKVMCWGVSRYGNIQDNPSFSALAQPMPVDFDLHSGDADLDGWLDLWDDDDDNDGFLDAQDAFPLDACAHMDTDGDGMPDEILSSCQSPLVQDDDDDGDGWSDADEAVCGTEPKQAYSLPGDPDGDGLCNAIDDDDDGDGWSDVDEWACETRNNARSFQAHTSWGPRNAYAYGATLEYNQGDLWLVGAQSINDQAIYEYPEATYDNSASYDYSTWRYNIKMEAFDHDGKMYVSGSNGVYEMPPDASSPKIRVYERGYDSSSYHTDAAVSSNGTMYVFDYNHIDVHYLESGEDSAQTIPRPRDDSNEFQLAVSPAGVLSAADWRNTGDPSTTGWYVYEWDGSTWSGALVHPEGVEGYSHYRQAEYAIDPSGAQHLAYLNSAGGLRYLTDASSSGGTWTLEHSASIGATYNHMRGGMAMEVADDGDVHILYYDQSDDDLVHSRRIDGNWFSTVVWNFDADDAYYNGIDMVLDEQGDPRMYAHVDQVQGDAMMIYYGSFSDPSIDNGSIPSDSNSDGTCDALAAAVLDYGPGLTFEMGFNSAFTPLYEGLLPTSISISPSLPLGVTIDTTTGVISGTPVYPDPDGTIYTVTTTSSNDVWFGQIELRVMDAPPMISDVTTLSYYDISRARQYDSYGVEYDEDGNSYVSAIQARGSCGSEAQVYKLNADGALQWCTAFTSLDGLPSGNVKSAIRGMKIAPDGSIVVTVVKSGDLQTSYNHGTSNPVAYDIHGSNMMGFGVVKLDPSTGAPLWTRLSNVTQHFDGTPINPALDNYGSNYGAAWIRDSLSIDDSGSITFSYNAMDYDYGTRDMGLMFAGMEIPTGSNCHQTNNVPSSRVSAGVIRLSPQGESEWLVDARPMNGSSCNTWHSDSYLGVAQNTDYQPGDSRTISTAHPDGTVSLAVPFRGNLSIGGVTVEGNNLTDGSFSLAIARISQGGQVLWADAVTSLDDGLSAFKAGAQQPYNSDWASMLTYPNGDLGIVFSDRDYASRNNDAPTISFLGEERTPATGSWLAVARIDSTGTMAWLNVVEGAGIDYGHGTLHSVLDESDTVRILVERDWYDSSNTWDSDFGSLRMLHLDELGRLSATSASTGTSSWNYLGQTQFDDIAIHPSGDTVIMGKPYNQKWGKQTASATLSDGQYIGSSGGLFRLFNSISHEAEDNFAIHQQYNQLMAESDGTLTSWAVVEGTLPQGLSINAATGIISGTPTSLTTTGQEADITLRQSVSVGGESIFRTIDVTVIVADRAPEVLYDTVGKKGWSTGSSSGADHYPFETALNNGVHMLGSTNQFMADSIASIERTIKVPSGTSADFRVRWGTSSEGSDRMELWIDNVYIASRHGSMTTQTFEITEGEHTVQVRYVKNSNSDGGTDTGYIDEASFFQRNTNNALFPGSIVSFDPSALELTRGIPMGSFEPIGVAYSEFLYEYIARPELPPALNLDELSGILSGTPAVNTHAPWDDLTALVETYDLRACNDWHTRYPSYNPVCDDNPIGIKIVEQKPDFSYGDSNEVELPRDLYAELLPTNSGGESSFWTLEGELPYDLSFDHRSGKIYGNPYLITAAVPLSITAVNTGGATTVDLTLSVIGEGISLTFPTPSITLVDGQEMQPFAGQTSGSPVQLWLITPELPAGLSFGESNGTIWGTPEAVMQMTEYSVQVVSGTSTDTEALFITVAMDTGGDSDLDGWKDDIETICNTDPNHFEDRPLDTDGDGICDYLDADTDGDGETDEREQRCGSDPLDAESLPPDANENGFCDAEEEDRDEDGILDFLDAFPDDASANRDTDGDGMPDELTGQSTSTPPLVEDLDDDGDGWLDIDESLCGSNPKRLSDFPPDMDGDMICDTLDDDIDGDGWLNEVETGICGGNPLDVDIKPQDMDGDMICDTLDDDIDGDGWLNEVENRTACGSTDIFDPDDYPSDEDSDGICDGEDTSPSSSLSSITDMWWLCCLLLLLLLLLALIPLLRGRNKTVLDQLAGPEPPNTTSKPKFASGAGTKSDPFVLEPSVGVPAGGQTICSELITISNIDPNNIVPVTDRNEGANGYRFNLTSDEHQESDNDLLVPDAKGRVSFRFEFEDRVPTRGGATFEARYRVGRGSVHFLWRVTVDPEPGYAATEEEMEAIQTEQRRLAEEAAERRAAENEILRARAEAEQARMDAERARAEAEQAKAQAAAAAAAAAAADKQRAEEEAQRAKSQAEAEAAAAAAAERKRAEEEALKAKAEAEAAAAAAAERQRAEQEAIRATEAEAAERIKAMNAEIEARRLALEEMDDKQRKKEEELIRVAERAKDIDFSTLGVAARSSATAPVEKGAEELAVGDTSAFEDAGSAWIQDDQGGLSISWTGKTAAALTGVKGLKRAFAAAAVVTARDDLQAIKGVGPFIEEKLNMLGITTFKQVANMTPELEEQVNTAIEFFPGRVRRDKWAAQAADFMN